MKILLKILLLSGLTSPAMATGLYGNSTKTPFFVNLQAYFVGTSGTCNFPKPAGLQVNDLIFIYMFDDSNMAGMVPPSGFTQALAPQPTGDGSGGIYGYHTTVYWKIATSADVAASSYTFTKSPSFYSCGGQTAIFRNTDRTTPIQSINRDYNNPMGTTLTFTSRTSTKNNSLSIAISEVGTDQVAATNPTGWKSEWVDNSYGTRFSTKQMPAAGATGGGTVTYTGGPYYWATTMVILNPFK